MKLIIFIALGALGIYLAVALLLTVLYNRHYGREASLAMSVGMGGWRERLGDTGEFMLKALIAVPLMAIAFAVVGLDNVRYALTAKRPPAR